MATSVLIGQFGASNPGHGKLFAYKSQPTGQGVSALGSSFRLARFSRSRFSAPPPSTNFTRSSSLHQSSSVSMSESVKLFIGGLAWATNDESLREAFSKYGRVTDAVVMKDRETQRSRGFGFVSFSSDEEAQKAIDGMNNCDLDGRTIRVDRATGGSSRGGDRSGGFGGQRSGGFGGNRDSGSSRGFGREGGNW